MLVLSASTAGGMSSILGQGSKILKTMQHGKKRKKKISIMPVMCPVTLGCKGGYESRGQTTPSGEHHFKKASQKKDEEELARQRAELNVSQAKKCMREKLAHSRNYRWSAVTGVMI